MAEQPELTDVREAHRIDEPALADYLRGKLEDFKGPMAVQQFEGGQSNPTYVLSANGQRWVMRKRPPGKLLPSAHAVDREYRVITALQDTEVPVPETYLYCEDPEIVGTDFFIMEMVDGRVTSQDALPNLEPNERRGIHGHLIEIMAALHQVDYDAVGLADYGRPGNYFGRQISRWSRQYQDTKTDDLPEMDKLIEWLPENIPEDDASSIAHGDFRMGNMLIHPTEPRIVAVLDWELSTLGHPMGDLSYNATYTYCTNFVPFLDKLTEMGLPTEEEYLARYGELTGREVSPRDWSFYLAYNRFRSAGILQGVYKRGLDGNAASDRALAVGAMVKIHAEASWKLIEEAFDI